MSTCILLSLHYEKIQQFETLRHSSKTRLARATRKGVGSSNSDESDRFLGRLSETRYSDSVFFFFGSMLLNFINQQTGLKLRTKITHCYGKASHNRDEYDTQKRRNADDEVYLVDLPDDVGGRDVNEANDGGDYNGAEDEVRGVEEEGHEEEESDHHCDRHHYVRHCCFGPCIVIHSRPGEGTCNTYIQTSIRDLPFIEHALKTHF